MTVIEIIGSDKVRTEWMDAKTRSRKEDVWACTSLVVPGDDFVYVG